jgi:hypothetical protein
MTDLIHLSENSRFYVAICKSDEHSWLTLGAIDSKTKKKHTLAYFGKRLTYLKDYGCIGRMKTIYSTVPGVLTRDYRFRNALEKDREVKFEYKAFEMSYENYVDFAKQLKALLKGKYQDYDDLTLKSHKNQLYFPQEENSYSFEFSDVENIPDDGRYSHLSEIDGTDVERLGSSDNCRHTSISLLESFIPDGAQMTRGISKFAYQHLPFKAIYHQDEIISQFYVLPVPPEMPFKDNKHALILNKLYKRLEEIPNIKPDSKETKSKFKAVKVLYDSLAEDRKLKTSNMISRITAWESSALATKNIDHRRWFWTPATKTRKVVEQVKEIAQYTQNT